MAPSILHGPVIGGGTGAQTFPVTIPATTAGNCVLVAIGAWNALTAETVTGVTLGGSATGWSRAVSQVNTTGQHAACEIWACPNCVGGQTAISVTTTGGSTANTSAAIFAWEAPGIASASPLDRAAVAPGNAGSWSAGPVATTTQADELAVGLFIGADLPGDIVTGPGAPWTVTAMQTVSIGGFAAGYAMAGTQILSAPGTPSFAGTQNDAGRMNWAAVIATFRGAAAPPAAGNTGAFFPFFR